MKRYIDADNLMEFANNTEDKMIDAYDIARFPTADVRENVHGEWIPCGGSFRCSECASMPEFKDIRRLHYCPNCGAEMRYRQMLGTIVKCEMEDCLYCLNGECVQTEIYLSDDHVCDGGCDEGWEVANERSNKQTSGD